MRLQLEAKQDLWGKFHQISADIAGATEVAFTCSGGKEIQGELVVDSEDVFRELGGEWQTGQSCLALS